jgi:diaminohydroxyphosphoribosylaminopyrimidine deaminase / 5-amino-6-(5-phosphoribosylamino)uracil reductase
MLEPTRQDEQAGGVPMASGTEIAAMRRAIDLATRGLSTTLPNPVVGCVLLGADGSIVAEGWHERPGGPHAEVVALTKAGPRAQGATAIVTLEPCAHHGRTGPCADALLAAGVRRVVIAVPDPSEAAAGGADRLRAGGVEVEMGVLAEQARVGNEPWLTSVRLSRPFVTWKLAASLDGRIAAADGTSRWITGPAAQLDGYRLRAEVDTMLVGVGTVLADDPQLTARDGDGRPLPRQPLRVVVDSTGRTPAKARVRNDAAPTWIATAAEVGADEAGRVDLRALLDRLYARERRHVLLEGGPRLAGAMVAAGLVDRVVGYLAPVLLGSGRSALEDAGIDTIAAALRLELLDVRQIGTDLRLIARPLRPDSDDQWPRTDD